MKEGVLFCCCCCYWNWLNIIWSSEQLVVFVVAIFVPPCYSVHNTQYTLTIRIEITTWRDRRFRKWIFHALPSTAMRSSHTYTRLYIQTHNFSLGHVSLLLFTRAQPMLFFFFFFFVHRSFAYNFSPKQTQHTAAINNTFYGFKHSTQKHKTGAHTLSANLVSKCSSTKSTHWVCMLTLAPFWMVLQSIDGKSGFKTRRF